MPKILVTGATGTLGREVVARALSRGASVRALVRRATDTLPAATEIAIGDLLTGDGLAAAFDDVDVVIHCATEFGPAVDAESTVARNIIEIARKGKQPHFVYISIIGVDTSAFSYFKEKLGVEQLIERSGLPFTILRATQFHPFVLKFLRSFEIGNSIRVPRGLTFQPVAEGEVAEELAKSALKPAQGLVPPIAGPEILTLEDMARAYVRIARSQLVVEIEPEENTSEYHVAFGNDDHVSAGHAVGHLTWEAYLQAHKINANID